MKMPASLHNVERLQAGCTSDVHKYLKVIYIYTMKKCLHA